MALPLRVFAGHLGAPVYFDIDCRLPRPHAPNSDLPRAPAIFRLHDTRSSLTGDLDKAGTLRPARPLTALVSRPVSAQEE